MLRPVEIDPLILGMDDLLSRSLGHTIDIRTELGAGRAAATTDANQVELAILNLAINARDAMPEGGILTISTRIAQEWGEDLKPGRYVVITVSDTGTGIPPELLDKVFDPFFTTKAIGRGTGLGLSQVYGIARQMRRRRPHRERTRGRHENRYLAALGPLRKPFTQSNAAGPTQRSTAAAKKSWWWTTTRMCADSSSSAWRRSIIAYRRRRTARPASIAWSGIARIC